MKNVRKKLVVVGNGMAGGRFVEELLERDLDRYEISVIGDEPHGNYNRIKLVVKLRNDDLPDFMLQPPEWYRARGVDLHLGEHAGLVFNKGIAVNERMQTSDPNVYACGECIEFKGETWGLVAPVWEQARTLAAVLSGEDAVYEPARPTATRLKSDIPAISMGRFKPDPEDELVHFTDPHAGIFKQLIVRDNILQGAILIGEDLNVDVIELHYSARIPLPERRTDLLFPGSHGGEAIVDGKFIPDEARVCECNGVSAAKIRKAIANGSDTMFKVMKTTRAGTGCGNCKNRIKALLISEVGELRTDPAENYYAPGVPMDRMELTAFIIANHLRSVSAVLDAIPGSTGDAKTRMALDYLLNYIWKSQYEIENDSRCANDRYAGNIQNDGRFSVIPEMAGGITTSAHLRALADVADHYDAMIKVTGADRIGLFSIEKKDLKDAWDMLQMTSGHAFTKCFRACKSCVGSTHCRFGLMDSLELGRKLGQRYRGIMSPAKLKMGVSGCPRNCAEATIKDFGVVAAEDAWDIYIGGNGGAKVYVGQKIAQVKTDEEVIQIADRLYEYYRRNGRYGERTAHFIERVGLQSITQAILQGSAEEMQELEDRLQEAIDNYIDPWTQPIDVNDVPGQIPADKTEARQFTTVAGINDIPAGSSRLYTIGEADVAIFHTRDDQWVAVDALCPHAAGPMIDSIYGDGRLSCPLHSYTFDIASGACDNPEIDKLIVHDTRIVDNQIQVALSPETRPVSACHAGGCSGCGRG